MNPGNIDDDPADLFGNYAFPSKDDRSAEPSRPSSSVARTVTANLGPLTTRLPRQASEDTSPNATREANFWTQPDYAFPQLAASHQAQCFDTQFDAPPPSGPAATAPSQSLRRKSSATSPADEFNLEGNVWRHVEEELRIDRPLRPDEQAVVDRGFVSAKHIRTFCPALQRVRGVVSVRLTHLPSIKRIDQGAQPKSSGDKGVKTIKQGTVDDATLARAKAADCEGFVGERGPDGSVIGLRMGSKIKQLKDSGDPFKEALWNFLEETDNGRRYYPLLIDEHVKKNIRPLQSMAGWQRFVLSGDYDLHDAYVNGKLVGDKSPEQQRVMRAINTGISCADPEFRPFGSADDAMVQHGHQAAYTANQMDAVRRRSSTPSLTEAARRGSAPSLVLLDEAVAKPSFPLAFCDGYRWKIVENHEEYLGYLEAHELPVKDPWSRSPNWVFEKVPDQPGKVVMRRRGSQQSLSQAGGESAQASPTQSASSSAVNLTEAVDRRPSAGKPPTRTLRHVHSFTGTTQRTSDHSQPPVDQAAASSRRAVPKRRGSADSRMPPGRVPVLGNVPTPERRLSADSQMPLYRSSSSESLANQHLGVQAAATPYRRQSVIDLTSRLEPIPEPLSPPRRRKLHDSHDSRGSQDTP